LREKSREERAGDAKHQKKLPEMRVDKTISGMFARQGVRETGITATNH
jgi:hypothetical protein